MAARLTRQRGRASPALLVLLALGLFAGGAAWAAEPQRLELPSLDSAVSLPGYWFPATGVASPAPAVVLLHGCGGLLDSRGQVGTRVREMAAQLNALGIHALATDSFTPRNERENCTQRVGQRRITMVERRRDALGALKWLAAQPGVDGARLGVLGWSNGGSTVLAASNLRHAEVTQAPVRPSLAVAFYPGCESELLRGYTPAAPLLMLLGELDDWTPAAPCKALATAAVAASGLAVQWEAYEGAYHGFDGTTPVRLRRDVPGGTHPGEGVHVGADAAARAAAATRLAQFLRTSWKLAP